MNDNVLSNLSFSEQTPSWRWDFVRALMDENRKPNRTTEPLVARAWRFLRRWIKGSGVTRMQLQADYPDIYAAYALYANPQSERWIVEAGLLSDASFEKVGEFVGKPASVIELYGKLFYDIRDKRAAKGYIANRVLMPAAQRGMDGRDYDFFMKTMAYFAGWSAMTEFVCDGELTEDMQTMLNNNFVNRMLKLGYIATHRLEVNNYNAIEVIEQCVKLRELEQTRRGPLSQNETWSVMESLLRKCATTAMSGTSDHEKDGQMIETLTYPAHEPRVLENTSGGRPILTYGDPIPICAPVDAGSVASL
jgi:hypothetical protein